MLVYQRVSKHIKTRFWIHCWTLADGTWFFTPISTVTSHTLRILLEFVMWMAYMVREAYRSTPKNALDILKHKSIAMKNHHVHCKSSTNGPFSMTFFCLDLTGGFNLSRPVWPKAAVNGATVAAQHQSWPRGGSLQTWSMAHISGSKSWPRAMPWDWAHGLFGRYGRLKLHQHVYESP